MPKPRLAIMVSIYNSGEWLENRLQNLKNLDNFNECEIWCVNADSPDERDHTIGQKFKGQNIRYEKLNERITVYETWNHIIKSSDSQFVTNANTDDIVAPNCYSRLISALDSATQEFGFAYPNWYTASVPNQQWPPKQASPDGRPGQYNGQIEKNGVGHFPLWRRSLHDKFGLFDTSFKALADAEWWARCYYGGTKFIWYNEFLACYLWRSGDNLWHRAVNADEWKRYHGKVQEFRK